MRRRVTKTVQRWPYVAGVKDAHGVLTEGWGPTENVGVYEFDPGSSSEVRQPGQNRVIVEPKLYGPIDMPFQPRDKCVVDGKMYMVEGEPAKWHHGQANYSPGAVVNLRRVDG